MQALLPVAMMVPDLHLIALVPMLVTPSFTLLYMQALFRPVAMMVPDYRLIAEVQLYAAGFQTAGALAAHLVSVLNVRWGGMMWRINFRQS